MELKPKFKKTKKEELAGDGDDLSSPTIPPSSPTISGDLLLVLPNDCLTHIFHFLSHDIPDLFSAALACRAFCAAAVESASVYSTFPSAAPPFFLHPRTPKLDVLGIDYFVTKSYRSALTIETIARRHIGYSHGHIIFNAGDHALIFDAFSGAAFRSPKFPPALSLTLPKDAILTAPPWTASSTLVLVSSSCTVCWRIGTNEWVTENSLRYGQEICALMMFDGMTYCLDIDYNVNIVNFDKNPVTRRKLALQPLLHLPPPIVNKGFGHRILKCGREILLLAFFSLGEDKYRIEVYCLDSSKLMWVRKPDLGDWCLFVNSGASWSFVCPDPARCIGMSNCI